MLWVAPEGRLTQTWGEELRVEIRNELLSVGVEHAHSRHDVPRQTDADDLHDGLEDEQSEIGEVGVRAVRRWFVAEGVHEAIAAGVGRRSHERKVGGGIGGQAAQTQRLDAREERHRGACRSRCEDGRGAEGAGCCGGFQASDVERLDLGGLGACLVGCEPQTSQGCNAAESLNAGHDEDPTPVLL